MSERKITPPEPLLVRIEKPIYGGAGLARSKGKAIFTHYALPAELVTATITSSKSSFAEAVAGNILEASPDRTAPLCPHFGACGGCHYQHAVYPAQLAIKAAILAETLTRAHIAALPEIQIHSGEPFGYRNRIRLHLDPLTSAPSYRRRASHRLIAVESCPIAAPMLQQAIAALARVCSEKQFGRQLSQVEFSVNHDESEFLLAVWLRGRASAAQAAEWLRQLCAALQPQLPALCGAACHAPNDANPTEATQRRTKVHTAARNSDETLAENALDAPLATWSKFPTAAAPRMRYRVADYAYRVSLGAFFQVHRGLIPTLVEFATGDRAGELAWDLYAGVGLFSRVLAASFAQVVAVEGAPVSCEDLRANLGPPHRVVHSSTLDFLRSAAPRRPTERPNPQSRRKPDFVLLDPPRAGLGEEVTRLLSQIGPPEITYVSCDPATLSRDLRNLLDSGYQLQQLHLIDMFPQTFHLETVARLTRR